MPIDFLSEAKHQDNEDALSAFRNRFIVNDPDVIYLDGNSLGRLPVETPALLNRVIDSEWGDRLIRSWNEGWYTKSLQLGKKLATLIGAKEEEVIFCDNTSQNLFKLMYGALKHQSDRSGIVSDVYNFPSDIYILQGIRSVFKNKHKIILTGRKDAVSPDISKLVEAIDENTALLTLSHVLFKSSYLYNMQEITAYAHSKGAMVLWDLSHSAGALPIYLNGCNADMAVGCSYKYLNGGPGSPAFLYVREDLQEKIESPVWGWFGEYNPFSFSLDYRPATGIRKYMTGTPPILSLSAVEPGLDMMLEAGMDNVRRKSILQTEYLIKITKALLFPLGFTLGSPEDPEQRGSHVSLCHDEGYRICKALIENRSGTTVVIPDFREPDNIRLGITPLYTSFHEIYHAIDRIREIVVTEEFKRFPSERDAVT
ncbi:kynureninase [Bacteroidota bacterium]